MAIRRRHARTRATNLSQAAWLPVIRTLGMRPWFEGRLANRGAVKVFDPSGKIVDDAIRERVRTFAQVLRASSRIARVRRAEP